MTNVHPNTLGKLAVDHHMFAVHHHRQESPLAESYDSGTKVHLEAARQTLLNLPETGQKYIERYCEKQAPDFFRTVKRGSGGENLSWTSWLGNAANDEQLLNFLQWHTDRLERQQTNPYTTRLIEKERAKYKAGLRLGIDKGWLHPDAQTALEEVEDIKVYLGDYFDTTMREWGGYHIRGSDRVVIASAHGKKWQRRQLKKEIKRAANHEFNHAVLGELSSTWLDEAATEHIAQVISDGEPTVINPAKRSGSDGAYVEERALLAALANKGRKKIPARLFTRAYSEKTGYSDNEELSLAIEESWSVPGAEIAASALLDRYVERLETEYEESGVSAMKAPALAAKKTRRDLRRRPWLIFGQPRAIYSSQRPFWLLRRLASL